MLTRVTVEAFKNALSENMKFIEDNCPTKPEQVFLFGSLARRRINKKSDIDMCIVFDDNTNLTSREMRTFKGELRGVSNYPETDVVVCTRSQLSAQRCLLYREINRDKVVLNSEFDVDIFLNSVKGKEYRMDYFEITLKSYNNLDVQLIKKRQLYSTTITLILNIPVMIL